MCWFKVYLIPCLPTLQSPVLNRLCYSQLLCLLHVATRTTQYQCHLQSCKIHLFMHNQMKNVGTKSASLPPYLAFISALSPSSSTASRLAPCWTSSLTISMFPFELNNYNLMHRLQCLLSNWVVMSHICRMHRVVRV